MARSTAPEFSKARVNRAGRNIRNDVAELGDQYVIENWRTSHSHVLNAFQASLRNRARYLDVTVAQRLKRRATIYDKLTRRPNFSLSEMQDIAGCRLIFQTIDDLNAFHDDFHNARFSHNLIMGNDRYNYIDRPKRDGYRGIHDVYEYRAKRVTGTPWNRLRIELQYRTVYQHAWATAAEVAGLLTDNDPKFGRANQNFMNFFIYSSEIISRVYEGSFGCLPTMSNKDLVEKFKAIDAEIKLIHLFQQYNKVAPAVVDLSKNTILIFNKTASPEEQTKYHSYKSFSDAVRKLGQLETANFLEDEPYDVVLVRSVGGNSTASIRSAFRNYFVDTKEFVKYVEDGLEELSKS